MVKVTMMMAGRRGRRGGIRHAATLVFFAVAAVLILCISSSDGSVDASSAATTSKGRGHRSAENLWTALRRRLNVANTVGSALQSKTPYDRIIGCPVFAVTTPWGSPYLNMERMTGDKDETIPVNEYDSNVDGGDKKNTKKKDNAKSFSEESGEVRMIGLYFTDVDDAVAMQCEMKQLENLKNADIRVSAFSLAKAIRQASVLGGGLTTGAPLDDTTGQFAGTDGRLRYKLVPSKRQLFYAARCHGRERVGLCGDTSAEDAVLAVVGNTAIEAANLRRRTVKRDAQRLQSASASLSKTSSQIAAQTVKKGRGSGKGKSDDGKTTTGTTITSTKTSNVVTTTTNNPMEGYSGIPVFTCAAMQRKKWGRTEQPFFMNYEDLLEAWAKCRGKPNENTSSTAKTPPVVEVFNLMDVLTSMDRMTAGHNKNKDSHHSDDHQLLQRITFVPNSRSVAFKERITNTGNGKARLRPMR
jgi:hypothetical protein